MMEDVSVYDGDLCIRHQTTSSNYKRESDDFTAKTFDREARVNDVWTFILLNE